MGDTHRYHESHEQAENTFQFVGEFELCVVSFPQREKVFVLTPELQVLHPVLTA